MPRIVPGVLAAAILFLLPAVAQGDSGIRMHGAVASKSGTTHLVSVRSLRQIAALRVPGSLSAIHVGQRVELRGSTLRASSHSRVLARNVIVVRTQTLTSSQSSDDEVEIKGTLTSLSPVTVQSSSRTVSCVVSAGVSLAGFAVGDVVEMTCDLQAGALVLRKLEQDDEANVPKADDEDDDDSGPGNVDDDDDSSGPGSGDDDAHDHSGPGGGGDDD
jgi:hypothetical protein